MKFIPDATSRMVARQMLSVRKNSPTILFGAGLASMVGSTVLACRATLKLEEVLDDIEGDKRKADKARAKVDARDAAKLKHANGGVLTETEQADLEALPEDVFYTDEEMSRDLTVISVRGVGKIVKLYAPAVILGGVGVVCLTRSHQILKDRNMALTAAYVAVEKAFSNYRQRVIEKYGEAEDREMRYGAEEVDIIDEETGKVISTVVAEEGEPSGYARWFDDENPNWNGPPQDEYNWLFLRTQQNWANDVLRARGHIFLNEVYGMLGLSHTSAGAAVGWIYDYTNKNIDNYVDFGCWGENDGQPLDFFNGREGSILLDFNVDGPIWQLMDELNGGDS
jgi:Family of unknown function (DUF6353)